MQAVIEQFRTNIERARNLQVLYGALSSQTTSVLDLSDILRAAIVMASSALDHYVHELVRREMLAIWRGQRQSTNAFLNFRVSLQSTMAVSANQDLGDLDWLDNEIRTHHSWQSFQHPDRIADAMALVIDISLWQEVGSRMGRDPTEVRKQLELVFDRRNKIAHEADLDPTSGKLGPARRWPIDDQLVTETISFIEKVGETIEYIATSQNAVP